MKLLKKITMAAGVLLCAGANAQFQYNSRDLMLVLRTDSPNGVNLEVNIGTVDGYVQQGLSNPGVPVAITTFDGSQFSQATSGASQAWWAVVGGDAIGDGNFTYPDRTLWLTSPRPDGLIQTAPWQRKSPSTQGNVLSKILGMGTRLVSWSGAFPADAVTNSSQVVLIPSIDPNSYSGFNGVSGDLGGSFGQGTIEGALSVASTNSNRSDLYQISPGSGDSIYLGYFDLTPAGQLTFTAGKAIHQQPVGLSLTGGQTATFSVAASGDHLSYAWRKNGHSLSDGGTVSGATTANLTIANCLKTNAGDYTVVITDSNGSVTSDVATLTVANPVILTSPASTTVNLADTTALNVSAAGSAPLSYQWYLQGGKLTGQTNSTLSLTNIALSQAGAYTVVVANTDGKSTTSVATVTVVAPPQIAVQTTIKPKSTVARGSQVVLLASAKGLNLNYQWQLNGANILGATTATNVIPFVDLSDAGTYTLVVSNSAGVVTSVATNLTVLTDTNAPAVAISKPGGSSIILSSTNSEGSVLAFGTAADTARVTNVFYRLNGAGWTPVATFVPKDAAGLAATWTNQLTAAVGTNILEAYSVDWTGNTSKVAKVVFYFHTASQLSVTIDEHDTRADEGSDSSWKPDYRGIKVPALVVPPYDTPTNGASLYVNRGPYTLTAIPGHNQIFSNWSAWITGSDTTNYYGTAKYTFVMQSDLNLKANFIHNPWMEAQGSYFGLFTNGAVDLSISGGINLKLGTNQSFSGKLLVDGDALSVSGAFKTDATATVVVSRAKLGKKPLTLSITNLFGDAGSSGTNQVVGTLTDGTLTAAVLADQAIYTKTNYPFAGQYTMVLPKSLDASVAPGGYGFASITVDGTAKVVAAGALADSTALAPQLAYVSKDGRWPMFNQIYAAKKIRVLNYTNVLQFHTNATARGFYLGWMNLTNPAAGTLRWLKGSTAIDLTNVIENATGVFTNYYTNGFSLDLPVTVESYVQRGTTTRLIDVTNALISFVDGNLSGTQSQSVQLKTNNTTGIWGYVNVITKQTNIVSGHSVVTSITNAVLQVTTIGTNTALGKLSVSFDAKSGKMSGSFTNGISLLPTGVAKPIGFTGVVLQPDNVGYGYFLGTNQIGSVTFQAN